MLGVCKISETWVAIAIAGYGAHVAGLYQKDFHSLYRSPSTITRVFSIPAASITSKTWFASALVKHYICI